MRITRTRLDAAVFFGLGGRLTVNAELAGLHASADAISDRKVRGVFVDLENVTCLDCSGIGQLIRLRSRVVASGRAFGLVNLDRYQRRLLELLQLSAVCRTYGSRQDALSSFTPGASRPRLAHLDSSVIANPASIGLRSEQSLQPALARRWTASSRT